MTDREALTEFLKGAGFVLLMLGTFAFIVGSIGMSGEKNTDRFKVVDTYATCAIVQYNPPNRAESVYFLDCQNSHLSERE